MEILKTKCYSNLDAGTKTLVSIRDGWQEYYGQEVGMEPATKLFKFYRSADEIRALAERLIGIPVVDGHIDLSSPVPEELIISRILESEVIEIEDENTATTVAIQNVIDVNENLLSLLDGKKQLSLGYFANRDESDEYDINQTNIIPHHLAIVDAGRCGDICKFKDKGLSMDEIKLGEMLKQFLESIKTMLAPKEQPKEAEVEAEKTLDDFKDTAEFKNLVLELATTMATDIANEKIQIIEKAKGFLDEKYDYSKPNIQIMKDCLADKGEFKDEEVAIAFKLLEKTEDYSRFADQKADSKWDSLKNKEN